MTELLQNTEIPKYRQIRQFIVEEEIQKKQLKAGAALPSENGLSRKFNVSKNTVVKALNDLVKDGILYRVQGKGTFVNQLSRKPTNNIGVLVYHVDNPFYSKIVKAIDEKAHSKSYHILLGNTLGDSRVEMEYIKEFINGNKVDGLIICPTTQSTNDLVKILNEAAIPFVFIYPKNLEGNANIVKADDEAGVYEAITYLIKLGHRRIAFLGAQNIEDINTSGKERGYAKALKAASIPFDIDLISRLNLDDDKTLDYNAIIEKFSNMKEPPTATFAIGDTIAINFLKALREKKIRVPGNMSLIGCDDIEMASHPDIQLTTIAQPTKDIGECAADIIIEANRGQSPIQQTIMPQRLIIRKTCQTLQKGKKYNQ